MADKNVQKIPVAVLAGTGMVGQRFIQLLENHPWFEVAAVSGSQRSEGKPYGEICRWVLPERMPESVKRLRVRRSTPEEINTPIVFSALPSGAAKEIEPAFARAGAAVCSNASAYRNEPDVPILLPEVNPNHLGLIRVQQAKRGWEGLIVTNSNCTSTGMTVVLKALQQAFGVEKVFATSLQALSGAGYPGVASLDIIGNVIPFIGGEEEKVESEPLKILASLEGEELKLPDAVISAHTNRVAVVDGHTVCLSIALGERVDISQIKNTLANYSPEEVGAGLPSTPKPVIEVRPEENRPQPRLDHAAGKGMTTVVGRIRPDKIFDVRLVVFSHNTIRGAAGGSIYNAELLIKSGFINGIENPFQNQ